MRIVCLLILGVFFVACQEKQGEYQYIIFPGEYIIHKADIDSTLVSVDLLRVFNMKISDHYLITMTPQEELIFNIFDLNTMKHLGGFGKNGNGPGEFLLPVPSCMQSGDSNNFFILDTRYAYNIVFPSDTVITSKNVLLDKICRIPVKAGIVNGAFPIGDHSICGDAEVYDKQLTCITGKEIQPIIDFPNLIPLPDDTKNSAIANLYRMNAEYSSERSRIALFYGRFPFIRIWDMQERAIIAQNFLKNVEVPEIKVVENHVVPWDGRLFYINSYGTSKYIYAAYDPGKKNVIEIHIFNWDGEAICKMEFPDFSFNAYAVSQDDKTIYFTNIRKENVIYSYSLEDIL